VTHYQFKLAVVGPVSDQNGESLLQFLPDKLNRIPQGGDTNRNQQNGARMIQPCATAMFSSRRGW
jgi:hypothetical protein